jgi:hypothetical protein
MSVCKELKRSPVDKGLSSVPHQEDSMLRDGEAQGGIAHLEKRGKVK